MKIKVDENLPRQLNIPLKKLGHDVHDVQDERLTGHSDMNIWEATQHESRLLITQDLDFSDSRQFSPGSHHGVRLVRLHTPDRRNLPARVVEVFETENVAEWDRCFVVVTERTIRVLRAVRI